VADVFVKQFRYEFVEFLGIEPLGTLANFHGRVIIQVVVSDRCLISQRPDYFTAEFELFHVSRSGF
jgi:hypothetical protein